MSDLAVDGDAECATGLDVTHDFAEAVGIEPVLGRMFTAREDMPGGPLVVMIGYDLWQRRFAGDRSVVDRTLDVGRHAQDDRWRSASGSSGFGSRWARPAALVGMVVRQGYFDPL